MERGRFIHSDTTCSPGSFSRVSTTIRRRIRRRSVAVPYRVTSRVAAFRRAGIDPEKGPENQAFSPLSKCAESRRNERRSPGEFAAGNGSKRTLGERLPRGLHCRRRNPGRDRREGPLSGSAQTSETGSGRLAGRHAQTVLRAADLRGATGAEGDVTGSNEADPRSLCGCGPSLPPGFGLSPRIARPSGRQPRLGHEPGPWSLLRNSSRISRQAGSAAARSPTLSTA